MRLSNLPYLRCRFVSKSQLFSGSHASGVDLGDEHPLCYIENRRNTPLPDGYHYSHLEG